MEYNNNHKASIIATLELFLFLDQLEQMLETNGIVTDIIT